MTAQDWKKVKLGGLCKFIRGVSFDKSEISTTSLPKYLPILRAGNIASKLDLESDLIWVMENKVANEQHLRQGDIVICMSSGSPLVVGKTAQLKEDWEGSVGAFCGIVRPKETIFADYMGFWFKSPNYFAWRDTQARGANIQNLRFSQLANLEIMLPHLSDQKRIASILQTQMSSVAKAKAACETQIEAAKSLPSAYLRQVFNSPKAQKWPKKKLGEVCEKNIATRDPRIEPTKEFIYIDISSIDNKRKIITTPQILLGINAPSRARQVVYSGDVILSTTRPNLNAVALISNEFSNQICSTGFCVLRPKANLDSRYLFLYTQNSDFIERLSSLVKGALYPAVTDKQVLEQQIPIPSLDEQQLISMKLREKLEESKELIKNMEEQPNLIGTLALAVLQRAFNGEL